MTCVGKVGMRHWLVIVVAVVGAGPGYALGPKALEKTQAINEKSKYWRLEGTRRRGLCTLPREENSHCRQSLHPPGSRSRKKSARLSRGSRVKFNIRATVWEEGQLES
jgi:hypothetical protein